MSSTIITTSVNRACSRNRSTTIKPIGKARKYSDPELQVIATIPVSGTVPDVIDDHYYKREQGMFEESKHYDQTDRKGPKIFRSGASGDCDHSRERHCA